MRCASTVLAVHRALRSSMASEDVDPALCVVLPVYKAMPYLAVAVRDVLKQDLQGQRLELVCSWDGAADEDWDWLVSLAAALGGERASVDEVAAPATPAAPAAPAALQAGDAPAAAWAPGAPAWAPAANPANDAAPRANEDEDHPLFKSDEPAAPAAEALSPSEAAKSCRPEHLLRVVRYADKANRGQGAAMSLALKRSQAPFVAQMESDDSRPRSDGLFLMLDALRKHEDWDGVACDAVCFGTHVSQRMAAYVDWQNSLTQPQHLSRERFVEIPALHQTALFRRAAVDATLAPTRGAYRDGRDLCAADAADHAAQLDTPVDLWWWLEFFDRGLRCGRVSSPLSTAAAAPSTNADAPSDAAATTDARHASDSPVALDGRFFGWRQHARQRTRQHGRLSLENLRKVKVHFLLRGDVKYGNAVVVSVGKTLDGYADELRAHPHAPESVHTVEWRPSKRIYPPFPPVPAALLRRNMAAAAGDDKPLLRLFAYGDARARARVKLHVPDWDDALDIFCA
ncbi:hypothetical protein M885DRAFT_618849 [Pelagophyceae sp. CCMP2097]|nr:hypothetical protein M885DRAFT_618849 [Pelagophyceae sp. CCMP2097]